MSKSSQSAVCRGEVETSLGEQNDASNMPGVGATFSLFSPACSEHNENCSTGKDTLMNCLRDSERILFVEDKHVLRELVTSLLESRGYSVRSAGDGNILSGGKVNSTLSFVLRDFLG